MKHGVRTLAIFAALITSAVQAQTADEQATDHCVEAPCATSAAAPAAAVEPAPYVPGSVTRSLLQRQAQGLEASSHQYTQSGVVAQKVYERYVKSFTHPIPEHSASAIAKAGLGGK